MAEFYPDIKTRMQARRPRARRMRHPRPACRCVLGETELIARERAEYLDSLIDPELNRAATSSNLGADITKLKEGVTLSSLQGNQGMQGSEDVLKQHMKAPGLTFAQVAENCGRKRELVGTAEMVADRLQEIFESGRMRRLRRLADQSSGHVRAVLPQRRARAAASRPVPQGLHRPDPARESEELKETDHLYCDCRRLDRGLQARAERPSLHDKWPMEERRSLHAALRALVGTTGVSAFTIGR